ncbi:hypothetical protein WME90_09785 [Sorangium sp. So ce375]|uniref:hypothetical protein n=1 Tax=Sorangium sp. So ce375 TaxID=3133306 RepID=UPI003F5BE28E
MTLSLFSLAPLGSRARKAAALAAGFAMAAAVSGCIMNPKACTEMACSDGFSVTAATADKSWPAGEYTLELAVDGNAVSCAYSWTNTPKVGDGGVFVQCSPTVSVSINPVTICTETRRGDAVSQSCTPAPGQFTQLLAVGGTPTRVDVVVRRDGALLGERSFTPAYRTWYPNGEGCGPACRQDTQDWALP